MTWREGGLVCGGSCVSLLPSTRSKKAVISGFRQLSEGSEIIVVEHINSENERPMAFAERTSTSCVTGSSQPRHQSSYLQSHHGGRCSVLTGHDLKGRKQKRLHVTLEEINFSNRKDIVEAQELMTDF